MFGSYGWGGKALEQLAGMLEGLKLELLSPVSCKGYPREAALHDLDELADAIVAAHRRLGLIEQ